MKKAITILALIIISAGMLSACSTGHVAKLAASDAGKTINLAVGDSLSIKLEGNPTTGYNWQVTGIDLAVLQPVGQPVFKASSMMMGAGGVITLNFKAVAAGTTQLQLGYMRAWELDIPPLETYEITVVVK